MPRVLAASWKKTAFRHAWFRCPVWSCSTGRPKEFRRSILAPDTLLVSIEAATTYGWDRYVGPDGLIIGLTTFGLSGLPDELMAHFGITPDAVAAAVRAKLAQT